MATDYAKISRDNEKKYGTEVSYYGRDFADRYTERPHFIFELLQNAEDALRWRADAEPRTTFPRNVKFHLFQNHLEVTHFGLPFNEEHVRAICSIKRGTKNRLTDIGRYGIGFKSVYAYTKAPEVHSGAEHFSIESYVHPRPIRRRSTADGQTLFYFPFDHEEIPADQAFEEIGSRLANIGARTLLFLHHIDSVDWEIDGANTGKYIRQSRSLATYREVTLVEDLPGRRSAKPPKQEHWIVFSKAVNTFKGEQAGYVEIAFKKIKHPKDHAWAIVRAADSTLVVFFPTEKETHCGFLMQGPYKTTSSRDNVPHDDKWNAYLINETAQLVSPSLLELANMGLASVGLLQALPLLHSWEIPSDWMFRPVYDAVKEALRMNPVIPAANGRLVSGSNARIARDKGLTDLFSPKHLQTMLGSKEPVHWISSEITENRTPELFSFLRFELEIDQIEPEDLPPLLTEEFFQAQKPSWLVRFYSFLNDHDRLWQRDDPRGRLLDAPFIRLQDGRHVTPFRPDGTPIAYLPGKTNSDFDTVHRLLVKPKKCVEFFVKLGLTVPDIASEVLRNILPQYNRSPIDISEKKHLANLRKIFRAVGSNSTNRSVVIDRLKKLTFLRAKNLSTNEVFYRPPSIVYFPTKELEVFFGGFDGALFLAEPVELVRTEKVKELLKELGVEDKPRRVETDSDWKKKFELSKEIGHSKDIYFHEYDLEGLGNFFETLRKVAKHDFSDAVRRARFLWDFLIAHLKNYPPGTAEQFFRGEYSWQYYRTYTRQFDTHFLTALRSTPWLPGTKNQLHKPSEVSLQELPSTFARNRVLRDELQMKAEALVSLARKAGIRLDDIMFIRAHREEFERLKRTVNAKPTDVVHPLESVGRRPPNNEEVTDAIHHLLGNHAPPEPPPGELNLNDSSNNSIGASSKGDGLHADTPAGPATTRSPGSRDGKFFTYVYVSQDAGNSHGNESPQASDPSETYRREKVGRGGVEFVLDFEKKAGRHPKEMPQTHEGYDVESSNPTGQIERYIEVKSIGAHWGELGVTLSRAQFEAATRLKEKYWLYVVEVRSDGHRLYRIQDPALKVKNFAYDQGWRALAEPET